MSKGYYDLVTIDPGKEAGVAYFINGILIRAELVTDLLDQRVRPNTKLLIVELPQIYPDSPVDPATMLKLSFTAGRLAGRFLPSEVKTIDPRGWKGQRPKGVDNRYTMGLLGPTETSIVNTSTSRGKLHNVIDAVGIGLWELGRR